MPDSQNTLSPLVLLIEDNDVNRYTVARMLRQAGFSVQEAASGAQASQILRESSIEAIVCDVDLPDVDGFALCRQLKANPQTASIPFLQMSAAFTSAQYQVQGLEGGADGYLVQPFEVPVLAATIRALLRTRAAEEQARALSRQWQITFSAIRDGIVVTDSDGRITNCNQAFGSLFGQTPEKMLGESVFEINEPSLHFQLDLIHIKPASIETQINQRWFRVQRDFITDENGKITGVVQILSDRTNQKRADEEREALIHSLEFERLRLETIYKNVPASVVVLRGPEQRIELTNPAYQRLINNRDVLGKPLREAFPDVEGQGFFEIIDNVYQTGETFESHELLLSLQENEDSPVEEHYIDLLYQPLREADGTISGVFSHSIDITEQVRARKEAETANRLKDEFLATLSHELRTPLMSILGWTQLLRSGDADENTTHQALQSIERNAWAQKQLIDDILDVSRIISGKLHLNMRQIDLAPSIEGAVNVVRPAASAKNINLLVALQPDAGLISGDASRLQQVMWNLLSNAIKFTPKGGTVRVVLERVASQAQVTISDTGKGIAPEFLPHVFDRFRQADSSSTRSHGGLGLGLAIVRQLVEMHGGTIQAHSEGENEGSTFVARFPIAATLSSSLALGAQHNSLSSGEIDDSVQQRAEENLASGKSRSINKDAVNSNKLAGLQVLIVDDEPDARLLLSAVLQFAGAKVSVATSVAEAWLQLEGTSRPDILISDIGMPTEDGYALIRRLRESESAQQSPPLPAVALTAFARREDKERSLQAGFNDYAAKPIEPAELVEVVSRLVNRR